MGYLGKGKRKYPGPYTKAQLEALTGMQAGDRAYMSDGDTVAERVAIMIYTGDTWKDSGMVEMLNSTGGTLNANNLMRLAASGPTAAVLTSAVSPVNAAGILFSDTNNGVNCNIVQFGVVNYIAGKNVTRGDLMESDQANPSPTDGTMAPEVNTGVGLISQSMTTTTDGSVGRMQIMGAPEKA